MIRALIRSLPLHAEILEVTEAESAPLYDGLKLITDHIPDPNFYDSVRIKVLKSCKIGFLRRIRSDDELKEFSYSDLVAGSVLYIHDASENYSDNCTFQALPDENDKWHENSEKLLLKIDIIPVNNKPPVLVNNEVLLVWRDSVTVITSKELLFTDADSKPSEIIYETLPAKGGHLALRSNQKDKIVKFTQQDINNEDVVFVQIDDGTNGPGFLFQVFLSRKGPFRGKSDHLAILYSF